MKKTLALILALVMVLALAACGSKTEAPVATNVPEQNAPAATTAASSDEKTESDRPYYVRDASEVTGTVTVYTTIGETEQEALKSLWSKYYPDCKIEIQSDSVGTLATRIRSDESCNADVVIGGMFAADGETYHDIL